MSSKKVKRQEKQSNYREAARQADRQINRETGR